MRELRLIPKSEFDRGRAVEQDRDATLALLADMCRLNALVAVKRAGSGNLGSNFSALDVVAHLLFGELNVAELGFDDPDRPVERTRRSGCLRRALRAWRARQTAQLPRWLSPRADGARP